MGRWLAKLGKIRENARSETVKTDRTPSEMGFGGFVGSPSGGIADFGPNTPEVLAVLSVPPRGVSENSLPDPDALLALLREHGLMTYGAAASTLAWGASRAWRAEAELRAKGAVRLDHLGRMIIREETP